MDERSRERVLRPKPDRTKPLRGGTLSLFGPPDQRPSPDPDGAAPAGPTDAVARAVELGYRVVDDYIRQGQNAARLISRRSYSPKAAMNDIQETAARAMQYGAEFMDVWMQLLGQAATGQPTRPGNRGDTTNAAGDPKGERTSRSSPSRVALAIESTRPTEITVDIDTGTCRSLLAQELQSTGGRPPISDIAYEPGDPPRLRVRVPPGQPEGTYSGLVVDANTNLPAGTVVLRVLPVPQEAIWGPRSR